MTSSINERVLADVQTPVYIIEENLLRANLSLISEVAQRANIDVIMAFKPTDFP